MVTVLGVFQIPYFKGDSGSKKETKNLKEKKN